MTRIIDITVPLRHGIPIWPDSTGIQLTRPKRLEAGDSSNLSQLSCDVHTATHVDAPSHFIENGLTVERLPLEVMVGLCFVAYLPEATEITADCLADMDIPPDTKRLLLRTCNSELWTAKNNTFKKNYVALTDDAVRWVVEQKIGLIGVDYLSVQQYRDDCLTHQILLGAGVVILEGLNLADVKPGSYELICLPLKLTGAEGAPARVVLRNIREGR